MSLAIFDLDHTLLSIDSDHAWGEFLLEQGAVDPVAYKQANDRFMADYEAGTLDMHAFLEVALKPLADNTPEQLAAWHQQFMASKIEPSILPRGEELVAHHRARGDTLLIITATNRFITGPIAKRLGIDDLIAVEPEMIDGRYTGRVSGTPSYREARSSASWPGWPIARKPWTTPGSTATPTTTCRCWRRSITRGRGPGRNPARHCRSTRLANHQLRD